jgi:hypothetical protein
MKVWGLTEGEIVGATGDLGLRMSNVRVTGRERRTVAFKVDAQTSRSEYARRSAPNGSGKEFGRRLTALCHHGWRDLTDGLFDAGAERVQTAQGSWKSREEFDRDLDRLARLNIGSIMYPFFFIQACEEKHAGGLAWVNGAGGDRAIVFSDARIVGGELVRSNTRLIKQSDIRACPFAILVPTHYRADGSCKCDDGEERAMMIREWEYEEADFVGVPLRAGGAA